MSVSYYYRFMSFYSLPVRLKKERKREKRDREERDQHRLLSNLLPNQSSYTIHFVCRD
ncbi:hypothetical protein ACSS6W_003787 [Trichoderma asperelloides]